MTIQIAKFLNTVTHFSIDSFVALMFSPTIGVTVRFSNISGDVNSFLTEAECRVPLNGQIRITRMRAIVGADSGPTVQPLPIDFMDDGVAVATVTIPAGSTVLQDSGALNVTVAAGSLCTLRYNANALETGSRDQIGIEVQYERVLN